MCYVCGVYLCVHAYTGHLPLAFSTPYLTILAVCVRERACVCHRCRPTVEGRGGPQLSYSITLHQYSLEKGPLTEPG